MCVRSRSGSPTGSPEVRLSCGCGMAASGRRGGRRGCAQVGWELIYVCATLGYRGGYSAHHGTRAGSSRGGGRGPPTEPRDAQGLLRTGVRFTWTEH